MNVLPTTFFLDRSGKVIAREFGLQSRSVFVDHIKEALGGQKRLGSELKNNPPMKNLNLTCASCWFRRVGIRPG